MDSPSKTPVDHKNFVFLSFYFLGVGTLLPWNFFISVAEYWMFKWDSPENHGSPALSASPNATSDGDSSSSDGDALNDLQVNWSSHLAVASMVPNVTILLLNAAFGHRFKTTPRLFVSLVLVSTYKTNFLAFFLLYLLYCIY